tara:strand:+ start:315 stop:1928 length:1614 start_codon:yes stop_codon:yes gene_type:complete
MKSIKNIFKEFQCIYPIYLLLLVFVPILVGCIIDYTLFDTRIIIINLVWLSILIIPYLIFNQKWIYHLICSIYFCVGVIELTHWILLKGPITLTSFLVISNTNLNESIEFFDLKATYEILLLIPYFYLFILALKNPPKKGLGKYKPFIIWVIIGVSAIFILENAYHKRFLRKGSPQMVKVMVSFIDKMSLYQEAMQEILPKKVSATASFKTPKQTVVLILGESCNRKHMSLYANYFRKTNPKLEQRKDITVFNNVVSPYSNTLNSVLSILSQSNLEHEIEMKKSVDIIDVFHSAGFKTYWISNQSPIGIWDNLITVFAKKSDQYKFVNTTSNSSFEATYIPSLDSKLFHPFQKALDEDVNKKLLVLHLMGSHSSYLKRYPPKFAIFSGASGKEQTIAEYDNSVLYNDFIVDSLLNMLAKSTAYNQFSTAVYLSDHGENVYDEMDKVGHDYSNKLPKANVEIPFLLWSSPAFQKMKADKIFVINSNTNKSFVSDDLFHSILDLNGIESTYLEEERSIFNENFNEKRERILEDGKNYDN